jgi:hypothetical protein
MSTAPIRECEAAIDAALAPLDQLLGPRPEGGRRSLARAAIFLAPRFSRCRTSNGEVGDAERRPGDD